MRRVSGFGDRGEAVVLFMASPYNVDHAIPFLTSFRRVVPEHVNLRVLMTKDVNVFVGNDILREIRAKDIHVTLHLEKPVRLHPDLFHNADLIRYEIRVDDVDPLFFFSYIEEMYDIVSIHVGFIVDGNRRRSAENLMKMMRHRFPEVVLSLDGVIGNDIGIGSWWEGIIGDRGIDTSSEPVGGLETAVIADGKIVPLEKLDNRYEGFMCNGGREFVVVNETGDVFPTCCSLECGIGSMGNLNDNVSFDVEPIICNHDICVNFYDRMITKEATT